MATARIEIRSRLHEGIYKSHGGRRKTEIRNATPPAFRDVLLAIARSVPGPFGQTAIRSTT